MEGRIHLLPHFFPLASSLGLTALCPWERGLQLLLTLLTPLLASEQLYTVVLTTLFYLHPTPRGVQEYVFVFFFVFSNQQKSHILVLPRLGNASSQILQVPGGAVASHTWCLWALAFRSSSLAFYPGLWLML